MTQSVIQLAVSVIHYTVHIHVSRDLVPFSDVQDYGIPDHSLSRRIHLHARPPRVCSESIFLPLPQHVGYVSVSVCLRSLLHSESRNKLYSVKQCVTVVQRFWTNGKPICDFLLVFYFNCTPVFYCFRDTAIYLSKSCGFLPFFTHANVV